MLNIYTSNEKGLLTNDNASSSENLELDTNVSSSCLYAQNSNHNSILRKGVNETLTKRTTDFYVRKDNPLLLETIVIAKRDSIYDNDKISHGNIMKTDINAPLSEKKESNHANYDYYYDDEDDYDDKNVVVNH